MKLIKWIKKPLMLYRLCAIIFFDYSNKLNAKPHMLKVESNIT